MGRSRETFGKKEKEKKKAEKKKVKEERKEMRHANSDKGKDLDDMLVYVDENGNLSPVPVDPKKFKAVNSESIQISIPKEEDRGYEDVAHTGVVTFFNESKGFGFIKDKESGRDIFVHINALSGPLKENTIVRFEIANGKKGPEAVNVQTA